MAPFWGVVMNGTADFVDALPDGDHVSVVLFDRIASTTAILPRTIEAKSRAYLSREVRSLPEPTGKGSQARTDLGGAVAGIVNELGRPGANPLQFVFLFSDFAHDPGEGSPFTRDPESSPWRNLAQTARLATESRAVSTFALQLPLGRDVGRDLGLVQAVLPELVVAPVVDRAALAEWFARKRVEIQREKLRALVRQDAARGWSVGASGIDRIKVQSRLEALPLRIAIERLSADGLRLELEQSGTVTLPPSATLELGIRVVEAAPAEGWKRLFATRAAPVEPVHVALSGSVELQPAPEIATSLQIEPKSRFEKTTDVQAMVLRGATPFAAQIALAIALVLGALFVYRTWVRRPAPASAFVRRVLISERGGPYSEEIAVPRSTGLEISVGNEPSCQVRSALDVSPFTLRLGSRRPRWFRLTPKRGLYGFVGAGLLSYVARRRGKDEDRPLPTSISSSVPLGYASKVVLMASGRTFQITLRR